MKNTTVIYDHKDRNPFNNQKENLGVCTNSQNSINRAKWLNNSSSKYKGVTWVKDHKAYRASLTIGGKSKHLGYFDSEETAAKEYDKHALKHYKDFAVLNFPMEEQK